MTAFSSQAAVALENARLYTQTDQSLAARVEELWVMRRIDRELNASLDVSLALKLTLDWAMRQSNSSAGLVGMIEAKGVQIMAHQGYASELSLYPDGSLPLDFPTIRDSIASGMALSSLAARAIRTPPFCTAPWNTCWCPVRAKKP